jgi:hypothetical protein
MRQALNNFSFILWDSLFGFNHPVFQIDPGHGGVDI